MMKHVLVILCALSLTVGCSSSSSSGGSDPYYEMIGTTICYESSQTCDNTNTYLMTNVENLGSVSCRIRMGGISAGGNLVFSNYTWDDEYDEWEAVVTTSASYNDGIKMSIYGSNALSLSDYEEGFTEEGVTGYFTDRYSADCVISETNETFTLVLDNWIYMMR